MIVVVPYTNLHPRVLPAIRRTWGGHVMTWRIDGGDPYGYQRCLVAIAAMLEAGTDVTVIEHDIEARTGTLAGLERCGWPWCFCPYRFSVPYDDANLVVPPLGHTKFGAALAEPFRAAVSDPEFWRPGYLHLDWKLGRRLIEHSGAHRHPTSVIHHHDYSPMAHRW